MATRHSNSSNLDSIASKFDNCLNEKVLSKKTYNFFTLTRRRQLKRSSFESFWFPKSVSFSSSQFCYCSNVNVNLCRNKKYIKCVVTRIDQKDFS